MLKYPLVGIELINRCCSSLLSNHCPFQQLFDMKASKLLFLPLWGGLFFLLFLTSNQLHAQNCRAGSYYSRQYSVADVPMGYPYPKYDIYGNYRGRFQVWRQARWHQARGGHSVMVWSGYGWVSQWQEGVYYWFDWVDYEKFVGY